jgi:hypothetical protein
VAGRSALGVRRTSYQSTWASEERRAFQVRVLVDPHAAHDALEDLATWAETIDFAYAWAASAGRTASHWKLLPLDRVRRAVIGIHFAQTEPHVLRDLRNLGVLRVIADTGGSFIRNSSSA